MDGNPSIHKQVLCVTCHSHPEVFEAAFASSGLEIGALLWGKCFATGGFFFLPPLPHSVGGVCVCGGGVTPAARSLRYVLVLTD